MFLLRRDSPRRYVLSGLSCLKSLCLFVLLGGCQDDETLLTPDHEPARSVAPELEGDLITSDPVVFAEALRRIRNENEILVRVKDECSLLYRRSSFVSCQLKQI
jgi:hypothetical protein